MSEPVILEYFPITFDPGDAGADFLISQFFFDNDDFYNFVDKTAREKINIPIIPGIIPILNYKSIKRMAELNGHELPGTLNKNIEKIADKPEELEKYGIEYATRQAQYLRAWICDFSSTHNTTALSGGFK